MHHLWETLGVAHNVPELPESNVGMSGTHLCDFHVTSGMLRAVPPLPIMPKTQAKTKGRGGEAKFVRQGLQTKNGQSPAQTLVWLQESAHPYLQLMQVLSQIVGKLNTPYYTIIAPVVKTTA